MKLNCSLAKKFPDQQRKKSGFMISETIRFKEALSPKPFEQKISRYWHFLALSCSNDSLQTLFLTHLRA